MKNKIFTLFQISALTTVFAVTVLGSSAGTSDDPLVTKSYVDKCINDAVSQVTANKLSDSDINTIAEKVADITNTDFSPVVSESTSSSPDTYKAVELKSGKIITGMEGTEIILRSGIAYAYITGADTILDITTGKSLDDKNSISKDHLIIIPRSDGRGIRATENSWVLVKGGYTITDYKS
jgi:hypothetical protein